MSSGSDVEVVSLRGRLARAEKFITRVAYEPIGESDATAAQMLDILTEEARAYLASPGVKKEGTDV